LVVWTDAVFVMGCSHAGAADLALCDYHVATESVRASASGDVAVAGSIVMYHRLLQRSGSDHLGGDETDQTDFSSTSSSSGIGSASDGSPPHSVTPSDGSPPHNATPSHGSGAARIIQVAKVAGRSLGISFVSDHDLPTDATPQTHTIFHLAPEGPAAAAGAELGELIVAINGTVATGRSHDEVVAMFKAAAPGKLTLALQPAAGKTALAVAMSPPGARSSSGSVRTVTVKKASHERLGLSFVSEHDLPTDPAPQTHTIVVLVPGSAGAAAGVREGDAIIAINGTEVTGISQAAVNVLFRAGGTRLVLTLQSASPQR
jgi:membrane-associated protease RseP (regulator of RpoE activity)